MPEATATQADWALPKNPALSAAPTGDEVPSGPEDEMTAEQIVALLNRTQAPFRTAEAPTPLTPYKARPISFTPTRGDLVRMWAARHRLRLGLAAVGLVAAVIATYLAHLAALNSALDRAWRDMEPQLRQRYALAPAYVACIETFSTEERYTFAVTRLALAAWQNARTDEEVAAAGPRMERVLGLLAKVARRYVTEGGGQDPDQIASSMRFADLETQRERSRAALVNQLRIYNESVAAFNDKLLGFPGSWLAWAARLRPHVPLYTTGPAVTPRLRTPVRPAPPAKSP